MLGNTDYRIISSLTIYTAHKRNGSAKGFRSKLEIQFNLTIWTKKCHGTNRQMTDPQFKRFSSQRSYVGEYD